MGVGCSAPQALPSTDAPLSPGSQIEYFTHGQTNPFGLTVDPLGNFYSADSHSKPVMLLQRGGFYEGIGKQHDGLGFAPRITDDDHGSSAIAGIAYYADEKFPEEFRGNLFNGNPVTRSINRARLEWHGSTPRAIRMPDFLTCDDPWFRPIQVKLGPDGALWIADFYNPIIGHYEFPLADPRRDHKHGRIWRVVWRGEKASAATPGGAPDPGAAPGDSPGARVSASKAVNASAKSVSPGVPGGSPATALGSSAPPGAPPPDLTKLDAPALVEKLADPNLELRRLAMHEIIERLGASAREALLAQIDSAPEDWTQFRDANDRPRDAINDRGGVIQHSARARHLGPALWALERLGVLDDALLERLSADADLSVRNYAVQIIGTRSSWSEAVAKVIQGRAFDDANIVRRSALEALARHPRPEQLDWLLRAHADIPANEPALDYAVKVALREHLATPGGFSFAQRTRFTDSFAAERDELLAQVGLAVPTQECAQFLFGHLQRTNFAGPRAGEYLKHAALHLPVESVAAFAHRLAKFEKLTPAAALKLADGLAQAARQRRFALSEETTAWTQRAMLDAIVSSDEALVKRGIEAVRDQKFAAKLDPLAQIVRAPQRPGGLRLAALEASANLPASRVLFEATLVNPAHLILRKRAAELLVQNGRLDAARAALPAAPQELALALASALSKSDAGAAALLDAVAAGKTSPRLLLHKSVAGPLASRPKSLRDRASAATRDLPPEDARLNGVIAERAAAFRKGKTEPARGAQIFQQHCSACHRFRDVGGNIAPNLDGVAARGVERLLEDILDPHRNVDPLFRQTTIETTGGEIVIGANLREQADAIVLADPTGRDVTVPKARIKTRTASALSLMPAVYESALSADDLRDLLAHLLAPSTTR